MTFTYFHTIVFLVSVLLILNIVNRFVFMRFLKSLPQTHENMKINDLLDAKHFERMLRDMDADQRRKATRIRSWLIRIIITMAVVILLIIITGVLMYIGQA